MKIFIIVFSILFFTQHSIAQLTDYSKLDNWAAHANKNDFGDSIPEPLKKTTEDKKLANVFFIHPTTYTQKGAYENAWNASVDNIELNQKTDKGTILFQASCFNEQSNIYAPRYRQAHLQSFYTNLPEGKAALDTAYNDIKTAFEYFLKYENKGMPIIIASHSQGTVHAGRLLKEYFEKKPLQKNLVAAYIIGMPVVKEYFNAIPPCSVSNATGCFVSWRTFLEGYGDIPYKRIGSPENVYVVNPISWTMDSMPVSINNTKGAVLFKFNKIIKYKAKVQVHKTILWISKPKFKFSFLIRKKKIRNLHAGDINMFYESIRDNVRVRLTEFFNVKAVPQ
jgi:hypothetical protein